MSENRNRWTRDFSRYDSMETEELEQILRSDAESLEDPEPDVELLLYVMGVLAERNKDKVTGKTALESYESFKQKYAIHAEKAEPKRKPLAWLRTLAAAAAILAVVVFGSAAANGFGFDIWETVAKWAQETFHFDRGEQAEIEEPVGDGTLEYASLADALYKMEKADGLVPTWFPEGYELVKIKIDEIPIQKVFVGYYEKEGKYILVTVQSYLNGYPEQIEQSENLIEVYKASGLLYYIFEDNNRVKAAWTNGSHECYISGELTIEEIKMMIDSI